MKVLRPVGKQNPLTGGFTEKHKGYDHDNLPDENYFSSISGVVIQSKNSETKQWQAFSNNDPYKDTRQGKLITADYGNYCIIRGEVDGQVVDQLGAHFQPGSVLPKGTQIKAGQVIAKIGKTGNTQPVGGGDGSHCHTEYRVSGKNVQVEFVEKIEGESTEVNKKQLYIDVYLGTRPNQPPSDDELNARLQENKNTIEVIKSILEGDTKSREYWLNFWGIDQSTTNWETAAKQYKQTYEDLKSLLKLELSADTEEVKGAVQGLLDQIKTCQENHLEKIIYKVEGKDFEVYRFFGLKLLIEKKEVV